MTAPKAKGKPPRPSRHNSRRAREWPYLIGDARRALHELEAGGAALLERASIPTRYDSFPTSTLGLGVHGSSDSDSLSTGVANTLDAELGLAAADDPKPPTDHVAVAADRMRAQLLGAIAALEAAVRALTAGNLVPAGEKPPAYEAPTCVNCAKYGVKEIATKAGRCPKCYDYRRRHDGRDAPESVVVARAENITRRELERLVHDGVLDPELAELAGVDVDAASIEVHRYRSLHDS